MEIFAISTYSLILTCWLKSNPETFNTTQLLFDYCSLDIKSLVIIMVGFDYRLWKMCEK
jgi:hypothetical protein